jgi:chemotaxis protein MotB
MRKVRRRTELNESSHNFWPSFADVMSALVLVLFFLMVLTFIQNIITGDNLRTVKVNLEDTENNLSKASEELDKALKEIDDAKEQLLKLQDDINIKEKALALSQALIDEQKDTIALTNASLEEIRKQMQGIALLRMDLLNEVRDSLQQSLSESDATKDTKVAIGDNANIIIGGNFLFEYNSAKINENAKPVLDKLAYAFYDVLQKGDTKEKIDSIIIAGHTDDIGNTQYNWELSTNRAQAVVNYLFKVNPKLEEEYGNFFTAAGFGENRPIAPNTSEEDRAKNRRIEISMVIKDSAVRELINSYLENNNQID